jgi:hypothetical protein
LNSCLHFKTETVKYFYDFFFRFERKRRRRRGTNKQTDIHPKTHSCTQYILKKKKEEGEEEIKRNRRRKEGRKKGVREGGRREAGNDINIYFLKTKQTQIF